MRFISIMILLTLSACGRESSPEGRMQIKAEELQADIDSLKIQNNAILDSITVLRREVLELRNKD